MNSERRYQIALVVLLTIFIAVISVAVHFKNAAELDAKMATASLDSVTIELDNNKALVTAGLLETKSYRETVDSLWEVSNARRDSLRRREKRQLTHRAVDITDTLAMVEVVVRLEAERDTAIADYEQQVKLNELLRQDADALRTAAIEHIKVDSVRFAALEASHGVIEDGVHDARAAIRPRWYKRWGRNVVTATKTGGAAVIGYLVGKNTR